MPCQAPKRLQCRFLWIAKDLPTVTPASIDAQQQMIPSQTRDQGNIPPGRYHLLQFQHVQCRYMEPSEGFGMKGGRKKGARKAPHKPCLGPLVPGTNLKSHRKCSVPNSASGRQELDYLVQRSGVGMQATQLLCREGTAAAWTPSAHPGTSLKLL